MNKYLSIFLFFISTQIVGQANKCDIGVTGGPGLSTLYYLSNETVAARGSAGVFIQYNFNKYLSLSEDFLFCQTGGNLITGNIPGYDYTFKYHLNYLTIPVLLKFGGGKKIHVYGLAGPYLGIFLNGIGYTTHLSVILKENTFPVHYKRLDGGITLGAGFSYPFAKKYTFICEIRNNVGLVNIHSQPNLGQLSSLCKNLSSILMLGVTYKLGKQKKKTKT